MATHINDSGRSIDLVSESCSLAKPSIADGISRSSRLKERYSFYSPNHIDRALPKAGLTWLMCGETSRTPTRTQTGAQGIDRASIRPFLVRLTAGYNIRSIPILEIDRSHMDAAAGGGGGGGGARGSSIDDPDDQDDFRGAELQPAFQRTFSDTVRRREK